MTRTRRETTCNTDHNLGGRRKLHFSGGYSPEGETGNTHSFTQRTPHRATCYRREKSHPLVLRIQCKRAKKRCSRWWRTKPDNRRPRLWREGPSSSPNEAANAMAKEATRREGRPTSAADDAEFALWSRKTENCILSVHTEFGDLMTMAAEGPNAINLTTTRADPEHARRRDDGRTECAGLRGVGGISFFEAFWSGRQDLPSMLASFRAKMTVSLPCCSQVRVSTTSSRGVVTCSIGQNSSK